MTGRDFVFGVSGFRARTGESFTAANLVRFGNAFARLVKQRGGRVVSIARDTRLSGEAALGALASALMLNGLDAVDFGIAPTPAALYAASHFEMDGSLTITASHNPAEWNGIEFAMERGRLLNASERRLLEAWFRNPPRTFAPWNETGSLRVEEGAAEAHIERVLSLQSVDAEAVRRRALRVVVDAGNGAGSIVSPTLMRRLGCETTELYCEPNGIFPRNPEPTEGSLDALKAAVKEHGADIGIAHDPDADRTTLIDETGAFVPEEYTFALTADVLLKERRGPIVTTVVTGALLDETAQKHDVPILRTPVGVGHVVEKMAETSAAVGGESTGGVVLPQVHLTTDGVAAAAVIASGLASRGGTLSDWVNEWGRYVLVKRKVRLTTRAPDVNRLAEAMSWAQEASAETTDGLKLTWEDGSWVSVRPSGTEPVMRVFAESRDAARAQELLNRAADAVSRLLL
ncbi:MAG: phosphoglucosamine mutase [Candidatus Poribacteria bacterium]|nr:phosphoglucosamine mutase [Candidatus Poribacteria bacterium]